MAKVKRDTAVQMYDDSWYLDKFSEHCCCDCLLTHRVKYAVENGRILTNWKVDTINGLPVETRGKP